MLMSSRGVRPHGSQRRAAGGLGRAPPDPLRVPVAADGGGGKAARGCAPPKCVTARSLDRVAVVTGAERGVQKRLRHWEFPAAWGDSAAGTHASGPLEAGAGRARTVDAAVGDRDGDDMRQEHGQPDRQRRKDLPAPSRAA